MSSGFKPATTPGANAANGNPPNVETVETLEEFAAWLYASDAVIEVVALENAVVADVQVSARDEQGAFVHENLALDSGTWLLVRVSDQPATDAQGGIILFERATASGDAPSRTMSDLRDLRDGASGQDEKD